MGAFDDGQRFEDAVFSRMVAGGETFSGKEFEKCTFDKCGFLECIFENCKFIDCTITNSMMSAAKFVGCSIMETSFGDSKLSGADWTKSASVRGLVFEKCDVSLSNFSFMKLPGFAMKDCVAKEVSFLESDCTNAILERTDFEKSVFNKTNLTGASLKDSFNYSIDFNRNVLKKTKFSMPEAASLLQGLDIVIDE